MSHDTIHVSYLLYKQKKENNKSIYCAEFITNAMFNNNPFKPHGNTLCTRPQNYQILQRNAHVYQWPSTFSLAYKYISLHNLASLGSHIFKSGPVSLSMVQFCTHLFDTALQPFQRDRDRQSPEGWKPLGYTLLHCNSLIHKQCEFHNSSHRILPCSCRCNHVHCPYAGCILHHFCMAFSGMVACHLRWCYTSL